VTLLSVRLAEQWTAGSVLGGVALASLLVVAVVRAVRRAAR